MMIGLGFAALAALAGLAMVRALRVPLALAPTLGLATVAVVATWTASFGLPGVVRTGTPLGLAVVGFLIAARHLRTALSAASKNWTTFGLLALALVVVAAMLDFSFAGVEAPVSTHDGAFHVEMIDSLRRGVTVQTWYPMGFHASVAALLDVLPWVDTARGTLEAAQGLSLLAPLAVFGVGLGLRLKPGISGAAALAIALTWTYPYDFQLWDGWPQAMGLLLLFGLISTALFWIERPSLGLVVAAGILAGAIVLTHGTEVYSSILALAVIALAHWRRLPIKALLPHVAVALIIGIATTAPYLSALLGWAGGGGASAVGDAVVQSATANPDIDGRGDWLQFLLGATGAASLIDLPVRAALMLLGLRLASHRVSAALWITFVGLVMLVAFTSFAPAMKLFAVTYPWLDDNRPRQIGVVFAAFLLAGGMEQCVLALSRFRSQLAHHPNAWRRLAIACSLLLFFLAEGSGVSIYKRLAQGVAEQNVYSSDAAAAMLWLRQHAQPGDVLANDLAGDAGIWAPYKADMPILLPRSPVGGVHQEQREPILEDLTAVNQNAQLQTEACALHVAYLFHGSAPQVIDERLFPDVQTLEQAPGLQEVFTSGGAAVFKVNLPCIS
jgi:hypothetical protein